MLTFLLLLFILISIINILYYIGYFGFAFHETNFKSSNNIPISVIICAKNEAENLKLFLPKILEQDYPNFEIIVINDASIDDTLVVIEQFEDLDSRIKIVNVENNEAFWGKKKYALTLGIKKAKNNHLLFIDADCVPESKLWITSMASGFYNSRELVLGYGGYFKNEKTFLNKLIRFETLLTAIQYFSYAKWGSPYMGVGRNLAYTSTLFYAQNGFANHLHLRSGDDDLFVNQAATGENTSVVSNHESITRSVPKNTFKQWIDQKRRHVSTAPHYKWKHKILLSVFYFTQIFFWLLLLILAVTLYHWEIILGILILRWIIQGVVFVKSAEKLTESDVVYIFPLLEIVLVFSQLSIFILNIFSKPINWK